MRYTFKVYERLKREQHIDTLFRTGKAFSVFPLRFICLSVPRVPVSDAPVQIGFSVPKKKFRSSVQRHRIRRLISEAWRLNKHLLYASLPPDRQLLLFIIFTDIKMPDANGITQPLLKGIDKLIEAHSTHSETGKTANT